MKNKNEPENIYSDLCKVLWQDLGDRNITLAEELDFEIPELNIIFDESES